MAVRYYSTHRPVFIGTFPKPAGNEVTEIRNFNNRVEIPELGIRAWGYLEYEKPLTEKEADSYELVRA